MVKKRHGRRNKMNIVLLIIFCVISFLSIYYNLIEPSQESLSYHVSLLTINSIFAGFMYTSLGIMAGIADKKRIADLDRAGYMDNYYNTIYIGLIFHVISIFLAILSILFPFVNNIKYISMIEQLTMFGGVIFFVKSVLNILKIIKKIRKSLYKK